MKPGFHSLCYHYLRKDSNDPIPRLLGTKLGDFNKHVSFLKKRYDVTSLTEIFSFYYNSFIIKNGLIFTFDDGLSDQYEAAKILKENEISGIFFIPTCIIKDEMPANPIIIHYAIALHGLRYFIRMLKILIEETYPNYEQNFKRIFSMNDVNDSIVQIKKIFHYELDPLSSREILIEIFKRMIQTEGLRINDLHLTRNQIKNILKMGHFVGTHSFSHISFGRKGIDSKYIKKELISPKDDLEKICNTKVISMSYPFGEPEDCLDAKELFKKTNSYKLAFTIQNRFNSIETSPLEIGRYMVNSSDNADNLYKKLESRI